MTLNPIKILEENLNLDEELSKLKEMAHVYAAQAAYVAKLQAIHLLNAALSDVIPNTNGDKYVTG